MSLLDKLLRRKRRKSVRPSVEPMSNERIQSVLTPRVTPHLEALGFSEQKPLHWLRSNDQPIRQLFSFSRWQAGRLAPRWGLSLDFVPHFAGSKVAWHRTEKSARYDISIEAHDYEDFLQTDYVYGERHLAEQVEEVALAALQRAEDFWERFRTVEDMPDAIEWWKSSFDRGGRYFLAKGNLQLAYAFSLAVNNRMQEAHDVLEARLERGVPREKHVAQLRQLLEEAPEAIKKISRR